jgi:hypothetical protein
VATEPREQAGIDSPVERLELLSGDDEAVGRYLDELKVTARASGRCCGSWRARARSTTGMRGIPRPSCWRASAPAVDPTRARRGSR